MRIRVVGRKQGNTSKEVGAAVATAVGAIKAGKHKGVIKGKCLWLYNRFTNIATIKLMLGSSPKLVVKLDIEEYKYTDIEAVLAAATKLYKEDEVSQFTSSAMYTNIKAISASRFLGYMDTGAISTIFTAMCEVTAAEATIPRSANFTIDYGAGSATGNQEYEGMVRTAMDIPGLKTSLTRFAWNTNWVISACDATVIQDVYARMVSSLAEATDNDWTDAYKDAINRALDAIRKVKDSVPAYFAALQTQYTEIPTTTIGADARELREAIVAILPVMNIGVGIEVLYRMFGVITIATVVDLCAPYINNGIRTYSRIANASGDVSALARNPDPIDFTVVFGQGCPEAAVETVTDVSTVYVDGAVATRVSAVPVAKYIMRYATSIQGGLEYTDNSTSSQGGGGSSTSSSRVGQASISANGTVPCALLMNITGADISEELQLSSDTSNTERAMYSSEYNESVTGTSTPGPDGHGGTATTVVSGSGKNSSTYVGSVTGSGTCSTKLLIPCKGIYAYGAGFPVSTDIQWSTQMTSASTYRYDGSHDTDNIGIDIGATRSFTGTETSSIDEGTTSTDTVTLATTPTYNTYPLVIGTVHRIAAIPIATTGTFNHTDTATYTSGASSQDANKHISNTATFTTNTTAGGAQVGRGTITSTMAMDNTSGGGTHTRGDTVSSTANMSKGAEYYPEDVYDVMSEVYSTYASSVYGYDASIGLESGGAMPRYPSIRYTKDTTQVYNTDYGVRYIQDVDAQSMHHTVSYTTTTKAKHDASFTSTGYTINDPYLHTVGNLNDSQDAGSSANSELVLNTEPMFMDGEYGPETAAYAGKVTIIDGTGGKIYTADIVDVISDAVYSGYTMRAVDYIQLFIPDPDPVNGNTHDPIINPQGIPLLIGLGITTIDSSTYYSQPYMPDGLMITSSSDTGPCGTYTKTVTPSTPVYTVDTAPRNIRDYNKLLRSPEFLVLNALMREEYLDTSATPPSPTHVPTFVPLSEAVQYMSIQGEGTPAPTLDIGYIQPWYIKDTSRITQVKERVNSNIATKLQELENKYLRDNPDAPVDEEMHKRFTPEAIEAVIAEQLFTPIRGILPAHTEVKTTAVRPVGAGDSSNAEPMDIEYVLSVVSRGIGTYVDLGVLV
jgi:hypothetical protein